MLWLFVRSENFFLFRMCLLLLCRLFVDFEVWPFSLVSLLNICSLKFYAIIRFSNQSFHNEINRFYFIKRTHSFTITMLQTSLFEYTFNLRLCVEWKGAFFEIVSFLLVVVCCESFQLNTLLGDYLCFHWHIRVQAKKWVRENKQKQ